MIGKFKERWLDREGAGGNPVVRPIEERETDDKNEDGTRYGNPFEVLTPEELKELEEKEKIARIKVPQIPPEMYEELDRAMGEGQEENALEVEKDLLKRSPKLKFIQSEPAPKKTLAGFLKRLFKF